MTTQCIVATPVRRFAERGVMWDGQCSGGGRLHCARWDTHELSLDDLEGNGGIDSSDQPEGAACSSCGVAVPWGLTVPCECGAPDCPGTRSALSRFGGSRTEYDTPSGQLEPGSMWWSDHSGPDGHRCMDWDNCDGRHLHVMLPNGHYWDVDSRANNCTLPDDRTHRCWIRDGEPPHVTAGKAGHTCTAGAGSIQAGDYHGFLQNGVLT